jgi:ubiquinone/menaquinone biosynthesis C-methylase UbiE
MSTTKIAERPGSSAQPAGSLDEFKQRAREQWTDNPCGAHMGRPFEIGTREYFDAIEQFRYRVDAPWMIEAIGFDQFRGKKVLEVGVGTGTDLLSFARGGAVVTGIDLTPRSIEIARKRFQVYGYDADLSIGDGEQLSFPDNCFDLVYSFGVLHHTPNTESAIAEIRRVLRPGGRAIVMLYHRRSIWYGGGLILKRGVFQGRLLRMNIDEMLSRFTEYTETGARPLVKAYTKSEARRLFKEFRDVDVVVRHLNREDLRPIGRLLPAAVFQWLARNFGWNLVITAAKPLQ